MRYTRNRQFLRCGGVTKKEQMSDKNHPITYMRLLLSMGLLNTGAQENKREDKQ